MPLVCTFLLPSLTPPPLLPSSTPPPPPPPPLLLSSSTPVTPPRCKHCGITLTCINFQMFSFPSSVVWASYFSPSLPFLVAMFTLPHSPASSSTSWRQRG